MCQATISYVDWEGKNARSKPLCTWLQYPSMLYAVVKYQNYRKEVTFEVLATYRSVDAAMDHARSLAYCGDDDEVVDSVNNQWVYSTLR